MFVFYTFIFYNFIFYTFIFYTLFFLYIHFLYGSFFIRFIFYNSTSIKKIICLHKIWPIILHMRLNRDKINQQPSLTSPW